MPHLSALLSSYVGERVLAYEAILTGLTNFNYWVQTESGKEFVIRLPKNQNKAMFNYFHEFEVLKAIAPLDISVPLTRFDPYTGIKITPFIKDTAVINSTYLNDPLTHMTFARLLKKLHDSKLTVSAEFNPIQKLHLYQQQCKNPRFDLSGYDSLISTIEERYNNAPKVLCHNDLVPGNILFANQRAYLIDYEYAGMNDLFFDLTSFINENNLDLKSEPARLFLTNYFDRDVLPSEMKLLSLWDKFHSLLWTWWALGMYEKYHREEYIEIATLKFSRLTNNAD